MTANPSGSEFPVQTGAHQGQDRPAQLRQGDGPVWFRAPLDEHGGGVVLQRAVLMAEDGAVEPPQGLSAGLPAGGVTGDELDESLGAEEAPSALRAR